MSDLFETPHGFSGGSGAVPVGKKIPVEYPEDCPAAFVKALKKLFVRPLENQNADELNRFAGQPPARREDRPR